METSNMKVNSNIARARSQATFDPLNLTHLLDGGPERTKRKRFIRNIAIKECEKEGFKRWTELSREEIYDQALRKTAFLYKKYHELNLTLTDDQNWFSQLVFPNELSPFGIHNAAFIPTISKLATKEQKEKWLPLATSHKVLGTYAQTELGHGTFLQGLETTATYDTATKEFVVDSPTITSTKFWPGGLGKTANFCVVMAKLIIDGRDCGMQSFLVQLRDLETHVPLPGISLGDIGTKVGIPGMDNGYLRMNKIRIPRENMLMRYAQVLEDGTYIKAKNDRLLYGSMTLLRTHIAANSAEQLAKAVTIATRYSTVRFQSEINPGMGEVPVMDFQTQQHKLFVQLATSFALLFASRQGQELYSEVSSEIEAGSFEKLPVLHAISCGLKAFNSWTVAHGIEQSRFACGGHGYLMASGIPKIYMNEVGACTYEGENTVLILQTARFINKCFEMGQKGFPLPPGISFLIETTGKSKLTGNLELEHLITAFEHRAAVLTSDANKRMTNQMRRGDKRAEAWNHSSQTFVDAAMAFTQAYIVRAFIETVQKANLVPSLASVLTQLCQLYATYGITKSSGQFAKGDFMSSAQLDIVQSKMYDLLADLKPNAVALVDAFDFPDEVLNSAIGRFDGNVYEALMESARNSKLNQNDIPEGIFKHVKPYVKYLQQQQKARL